MLTYIFSILKYKLERGLNMSKGSHVKNNLLFISQYCLNKSSEKGLSNLSIYINSIDFNSINIKLFIGASSAVIVGIVQSVQFILCQFSDKKKLSAEDALQVV